MKKYRILLMSLIATLIILFSSFYKVSAAGERYTLFPGNNRMSSAPYNKYYYYDGGISGIAYNSGVEGAFTSWSNTSNTYIWMMHTSKQSSSIVDVHSVNISDANILGQTWFMNGSTQISPYSGTRWYWAKIEMNINGNWTVNNGTTSANNVFKASVAHEIGHAFGLDHSIYEDTLMYDNVIFATKYNIFGPTAAEVAGVQTLYGKRY